MEIIKKDIFKKEGEILNIYTIGDIHEGNVNHAEEELKEAVKIIKNDPNGCWIGMGDYIEAITPSDLKRFDPTSIDEKYKISDLKDLPYKQMEFVYENLKPIQDKCLCLLTGNHEEAFSKHNSNNVFKHFAEMFTTSYFEIGKQPPRLGYTGFIKLRFLTNTKAFKNKRCGDLGELDNLQLGSLVIYCNHGDGGGGSREGYGINKVHDITRGIEADINLMGHIHLLDDHQQKITGLTQNNTLKKRMKYWGLTGCFLYTYKDGNTNYFEHKGRAESPIGMLKISIKVQHNKQPLVTMTKIQLG